jgi:predicted nucleic acid-binding Zn ribbon protein|tara:strand:+ start:340 stop:507 length:168 start_codon:yes stop_codon:yes gene_type:complete
MKKYLFTCTDCGDDTSILTQVSSGPQVILLCTDCYNLKYSNEVNNQIIYDKKEKS